MRKKKCERLIEVISQTGWPIQFIEKDFRSIEWQSSAEAVLHLEGCSVNIRGSGARALCNYFGFDCVAEMMEADLCVHK